MKMEEIESIVYEIVSDFFHGATVIWAEQVNTKPTLPFVTIKTGNINRTRFPIIDEEGRRFYPCSTILEINLYTKGKPVMVGTKVTGNYANTSASDLQDFFSYLDSENIVDKLAMNGIDISLEGPIRDLTNLQNDSKFRYRAMAEATLSYAQEANGAFGIGGLEMPNPSGGGTSEMQEAFTEEIVGFEIEEDK